MAEDLEEARARYCWSAVLRATWTFLVLAATAGGLAALTATLAWSGRLLLGALGLAAGASLAVGASGSARGRRLAAIVLGALTLPLVATHLATASARGEAELRAALAALAPFLAYAVAALLAGAAVARIWRGLPARPPAEGAERGTGEARGAQERAAPAAQEVST